MHFYIQAAIQKSMVRKLTEAVKAHSGESVADPYRYIGEHADVVHMLQNLFKAFPKRIQKIMSKVMLANPDEDLSRLQKEVVKCLQQFTLVGLQLLCLLVTVVIAVLNL